MVVDDRVSYTFFHGVGQWVPDCGTILLIEHLLGAWGAPCCYCCLEIAWGGSRPNRTDFKHSFLKAGLKASLVAQYSICMVRVVRKVYHKSSHYQIL